MAQQSVTDGMAGVEAASPPSSIGAAEERVAVYFGAAFAAFGQAERAVGAAIDRFYSVGHRLLRLRFAGRALLPCVAPALEHLAVEPAPDPDMTVCLWDGTSTPTRMPPPPWAASDYLPRGEIRGCQGERFFAAFLPDSGSFSMMDAARNLALFWVPDPARVPYHDRAAPLRSILHWWASDPTRQLAHAAAVGIPSGGVLLAGKGGSGKSTTALACLHAGLLYAGDDYVLIGLDPSPWVHSIYGSAKLNGEQVWSFPGLASAIHNVDRLETEKALLFPRDRYPGRLVRGFPVRAILLPRIARLPESRLREASPAAALAALAPTTLFQLPGAGRGAFQMMARFVQQLPAYSLELGWDIPAIPTLISRLLTELETGGGARGGAVRNGNRSEGLFTGVSPSFRGRCNGE